MRRAFSIFALMCFFASLLVHLSTFFGIDPSKYVPWVWVLHVGIFVALAPMIVMQGMAPKKDFWPKIYAAMPRWANHAINFFAVYAVINFALFFFLCRGGVADERDGKYVLHNHGHIIRELSESEYEWQKAYVMRVLSGHWMVFYLLPALVFWHRGPSTQLESYDS